MRRVDTKGIISTIAGTGVAGFSGDGGPATQAMLNNPQGIKAFRRQSWANLYIADYNNHRVRMIVLATGVITTVAVGMGSVKYNGNTGSALQIRDGRGRCCRRLTAGNIYIADYFNSRVRKVLATDENRSAASPASRVPGMEAMADPPCRPRSTAPPASRSIRRTTCFSSTPIIIASARSIQGKAASSSNFAGTGAFGYGEPNYDGNNGPAISAFLAAPFSTAVEPSGNVLILCAFELWRVNVLNGSISFLAGSDTFAFAGDGGQAIDAKFALPLYVTAAPNDDILLSDVGNYRVRKISAGNINTVAGTSILDGIPATTAFLNQPDGLALDGKGNMVIADTSDSRVRIVPSTQVIARSHRYGRSCKQRHRPVIFPQRPDLRCAGKPVCCG